MKRSCLGCIAYEEGTFHHDHRDGFCQLKHPIEKPKGLGYQKVFTAGFYGKGNQLIGCYHRPLEQCEKPMTVKKYIQLLKEKGLV